MSASLKLVFYLAVLNFTCTRNIFLRASGKIFITFQRVYLDKMKLYWSGKLYMTFLNICLWGCLFYSVTNVIVYVVLKGSLLVFGHRALTAMPSFWNSSAMPSAHMDMPYLEIV